MFWLQQLETHILFLASVGLLLLASQLVVVVLSQLERRRFGAVLLGTLVTPMCTGFPNLMIGLFGAERLQGDLILQLNIGNNLANTSLVAGLLIFLTGPLTVRAGKGKSKAAHVANLDQLLAFLFLWLGGILLLLLSRDGLVSSSDGALLMSVYFSYQMLAYTRRSKVSTKQRLGLARGFLLLLILGISAWLIQMGVDGLALVLNRIEHRLPGWNLGLFLGLLTVIPESFLLLRLAYRQGSLGLSGLVGDCLVSVPLVVGVSALLHPFNTAPITHFSQPSARPYIALAATMAALQLLSLKKSPVSRKLGLFFMALYVTVWIFTTW